MWTDTAIAREVWSLRSLACSFSLAMHIMGDTSSSQPFFLESHRSNSRTNGARDVAQLRESLPSMHKALGLIPLEVHEQGVITHAYGLITWKVKAG